VVHWKIVIAQNMTVIPPSVANAVGGNELLLIIVSVTTRTPSRNIPITLDWPTSMKGLIKKIGGCVAEGKRK